MAKTITILFAVVLFFTFTSLWGFYNSIRPPKIISSITPHGLGLDYEEVLFKTDDNVTLVGWFIPHPSATKAIILLHGYPADKGDILPTLAFLNKKYNLFLFDFRYLGRSEGAYSTAGAKETKDLLAAIKFLKGRGIEEVGLWGFSLGGAVAIMASPNTPQIKAIVSESSYASLDLMVRELYRIPILKYPFVYFTSLWAKLFLSIDLKKISPAESARNLRIPILLIHSKNDDVIPFKNALLIQEALKENTSAEFWFEENLVHGQFGDEYQKRIEDFFARNL